MLQRFLEGELRKSFFYSRSPLRSLIAGNERDLLHRGRMGDGGARAGEHHPGHAGLGQRRRERYWLRGDIFRNRSQADPRPLTATRASAARIPTIVWDGTQGEQKRPFGRLITKASHLRLPRDQRSIAR
jgi:hypothetical protein